MITGPGKLHPRSFSPTVTTSNGAQGPCGKTAIPRVYKFGPKDRRTKGLRPKDRRDPRVARDTWLVQKLITKPHAYRVIEFPVDWEELK
jgi:hypothetical protein